jgi:hypothetical protein
MVHGADRRRSDYGSSFDDGWPMVKIDIHAAEEQRAAAEWDQVVIAAQTKWITRNIAYVVGTLPTTERKAFVASCREFHTVERHAQQAWLVNWYKGINMPISGDAR